ARWVAGWLKEGGTASVESTREHFENLGRRRNLRDWHFIQAVFAVELWAKEIARLDWAKTFDWKGLAAQAVEVEGSDRTLYRETQPAQSRTRMNGLRIPAPGPGDRVPADGEKEAIEDLSMETQKAIRLAGLAVNTEKTYLQWIVRFSRFRMRRLGQGLREF